MMTWLLNIDFAGGQSQASQIEDLEAQLIAAQADQFKAHFILKQTLIEVSDEGARKRTGVPVAKEKVEILVVAE